MPDIFEIWMRILQRVEASASWFSRELRVISGKFKTRGAGARDFSGSNFVRAPRKLEGSSRASEIGGSFLDALADIAITISDALLAGLSVVTCRGATFAGRVAANLILVFGLPELMIQSVEEYEALACKLARDRGSTDVDQRTIETELGNATAV